jgi:hypothetical protein
MLAQLLINLSLLAFAMAEETLKTTTHGNAWKYGSGGGVIGFIVLILDILVFSTSFHPPSPQPFSRSICLHDANALPTVEILKSNRPPSHKLLWCVGVFLFPILGLVVYWLFSNREAHQGSGGYEAIP